MIFLTIAVTIIPCLLIFTYIYTHDEHPEPKGLIAKVALFGALSAIPVIIFVTLIKPLGVPQDPLGFSIFTAFVHAAIPEEFFKLMVVFYVAYHRFEFDEPFDGIIYGAAASLGFAMLENILYVSSLGLQTAIMRAFTAIPMHLFCGVSMGYFIGRAKFVPQGKSNTKFWILAFFFPTLIHGLYDASIFYTMVEQEIIYIIPGVATLLAVIIFGIMAMKKLERNNLSLLSGYYSIPEEEFKKFLPKGSESESRLPQMLKYFKEASTASGAWAVPHNFQESFQEKFGDEAKVPAPIRRSRGFLGFMFSLLGILWSGFGGIFVMAGIGIFIAEMKDKKPDSLGYIMIAIGAYLLINGMLLFLKGLHRNRIAAKTKSKFIQFLIFIANIVTFSALAIAISTIEKPEKAKFELMGIIIVAAISAAITFILILIPGKLRD
jgi:protease PrsW